MAKFLLVHGAAHGAWCWEKLIPALQRLGHEADAVDLPGNGADKTPFRQVTMALCAEKVARALDDMGGDVVLAGHSMGGGVITAAAELRPRHVRRLAYICAMLPKNGQALADLRSSKANALRSKMFKLAEDGLSMSIDPQYAPSIFYSDCTAEDAQAATSRLTPQATAISQAVLALTDENYGSVPRSYVVCTEDQAIEVDLQRRMIEASPCEDVVDIPRGHSPFLSAPEELAGILHRFAR